MNKKKYKEFLDNLCEDYCEKSHYCLLKFFLLEAHTSPRMLMQMKVIEKFKYERSKALGKEVGWQEATELWVSEKKAERFAEVYDEEKTYLQVYKEIMVK